MPATAGAKLILGNHEQFCAAFFHVLPCTELKIPSHICLNDNPRNCRHQCITLLVHHISPDGTERAIRYTTCRTIRGAINDHGSAGSSAHAENYMTADESLLVDNAHLVVYAEIQPCHHSGGSDADPADPRSCSQVISRWHEKELRPRGIKLTFRCANLYKAMWKFTDEEIADLPLEKRYLVSTANARTGLRMLFGQGIEVKAIGPAGWIFLKTHADLSGIAELPWQERFEADQHVEMFLRNFEASKDNDDDDGSDDAIESASQGQQYGAS